MQLANLVIFLTSNIVIDALVIRNVNYGKQEQSSDSNWRKSEHDLTNVFNGVYTECFLHLSYSCVQRKTLLYLNELNKLSEVSIIGDYVKFVKVNSTEPEEINPEDEIKGTDTEELSFLIDKAVDKFFDNHVMKFSALNKDISVPNTVEEFVGRKRRKGGGGGHHGGDDGGKKKMMMMAMMCMKMKLMMMVPAMMGMMGMMSFKGMMFSMMSFMIAKMMLLMKLLEKKGGGGGIGGADSGWPSGGGGGGAWMPAGGDYGGGGSGGGYDANGQWQSRSIIEKTELETIHKKPIISYVTPFMRLNNIDIKPIIEKDTDGKTPKSRNKRSIVDVVKQTYAYWFNRLLGSTINRRKLRQPNYKYVNGVKYVYYPMKMLQKYKQPKELQNYNLKPVDDAKPIVIADDFNKGEIVEGVIESRMNKKKFKKFKDTVNDTIDENPWE